MVTGDLRETIVQVKIFKVTNGKAQSCEKFLSHQGLFKSKFAAVTWAGGNVTIGVLKILRREKKGQRKEMKYGQSILGPRACAIATARVATSGSRGRESHAR